MKTNNQPIHHLFYHIWSEYQYTFRTDFVVISNDDITSKQVKSALYDVDCFIDGWISSRMLSIDKQITEYEVSTLVKYAWENHYQNLPIVFNFPKSGKFEVYESYRSNRFRPLFAETDESKRNNGVSPYVCTDGIYYRRNNEVFTSNEVFAVGTDLEDGGIKPHTFFNNKKSKIIYDKFIDAYRCLRYAPINETQTN